MAEIYARAKVARYLLAISALAMILSFQNCGSGDLALRSPQGVQEAPEVTETPAPYKNTSDTWTELERKRRANWKSKNDLWEIEYDGVDTPADNVTGPFMWDNPIDDDWYVTFLKGADSILDQFRLNTFGETKERGFLTVDRTYRTNYKTGSIYRRDEWLDSRHSHAIDGFTAEFRVKLLPSSQKDAFFFNYVANDCTISFALSGSSTQFPVGAISSGTIYGRNTNHRAADTISDFRTYRVVRERLANTYNVYWLNYADEKDPRPVNFAQIHNGECLSSFKIGSDNTRFPYVQIGDNSNDIDRNAAYILDFIRYRRDAIHPNSSLTAVKVRIPPALPAMAPSGTAVWRGYFGQVPITDDVVKSRMSQPSKVRLPGRNFAFRRSNVEGIAHLNTGDDSHTNAEIIHPLDLKNEGDVTIEARLKFLPDSGERGFRITHLDTLGAVSVYFSPTHVETALGTKPTGFQKVVMDTVDGFHTYRLVRKAGEMYAHLYIDNDPIPKIVDQHLSAETESRGFANNPIIWFGSSAVYPEAFTFPARRTSANVLIDYIRWSGTAYAPRP